MHPAFALGIHFHPTNLHFPTSSNHSNQPVSSPISSHCDRLDSTPPPKWEETGVIPEDEDIKIYQPANQASPGHMKADKPVKKVANKQAKKARGTKAVDLLQKGPTSSTTLSTPAQPLAPTNHPGLSPTVSPTTQRSPWDNGPP
ncbi:hypothetical protein PtB15_3B411 [Puccinia triticina]|nr:hypothetical protein PtB15_3B411 [Puccinia triticina]